MSVLKHFVPKPVEEVYMVGDYIELCEMYDAIDEGYIVARNL